MPKIKTNRVDIQRVRVIEPTLRELEAKMRQDFYMFTQCNENDPHDGKKKCEALWPIFNIAHRRVDISMIFFYEGRIFPRSQYEFCLDQGYADRNLISKWKKVCNLIVMHCIHYNNRVVSSR
ncbi:hypothetical protein MKW92_020672 [Papaver armeniacum]|nr:hypothetical protein MKW92_020672 [Papaver armeniacum]